MAQSRTKHKKKKKHADFLQGYSHAARDAVRVIVRREKMTPPSTMTGSLFCFLFLFLFFFFLGNRELISINREDDCDLLVDGDARMH